MHAHIPQTNALRLVDVKHLFVVPRIRSSGYLQILAENLPTIRTNAPGRINEDLLPSLRNLVIVDNDEVYRSETEKLGLKAKIDWREIFVWGEDHPRLNAQLAGITKKLKNDDVINIQFTRSFSFSICDTVFDCLGRLTAGL